MPATRFARTICKPLSVQIAVMYNACQAKDMRRQQIWTRDANKWVQRIASHHNDSATNKRMSAATKKARVMTKHSPQGTRLSGSPNMSSSACRHAKIVMHAATGWIPRAQRAKVRGFEPRLEMIHSGICMRIHCHTKVAASTRKIVAEAREKVIVREKEVVGVSGKKLGLMSVWKQISEAVWSGVDRKKKVGNGGRSSD